MFGKQQPDVVTDDDVGNFVKQLETDGALEIAAHIEGDEHGVDNSSGKSPNRAENPQ